MKKSLGAHPIIQPNVVLVVGSYDDTDQPNLMTVAWGGICCSVPPCIAITPAIRTKTYENIMHTGAFTVNIPAVSHVRVADYVGIYKGKKENKFEALKLTAIKSDLVNAPYVGEFPLVLECKVIESIKLGEHAQQFIGEILDVKADEEVLNNDGLPDIAKVRPIVYDDVGQNYFSVGPHLAKAFSIGKK